MGSSFILHLSFVSGCTLDKLRAFSMDMLKQIWQWFDDRTGIPAAVSNVVRHPVPPDTGWMYVFGSATLVAFLVLVVTGIILATLYIPSTANAYDSIEFITNQVPFGRIIRGMHYFAASAMVVFVGIHMLRVFLTGSFKFPREMNWLTGAILMFLVIGITFTGQILRWDQDAIGALLIAAEQAGRVPFIGEWLARFILAGETIGGPTLSRLFAFHVFILPGILLAFLTIHLFLVIRNGISEPPRKGEEVDPKTYRPWYESMLKREGQPFWPNAAWRDVVWSLLMIIGIMVLAIVFGPRELSEPPDPTLVETVPRPDWYFVWYFALQAVIPDAFEAYVIVLTPIAIGLAVILIPLLGSRGERSPLRRPWALGAVTIVVLTVVTMTIIGFESPWPPNFDARLPPQVVAATASDQVHEGAQLFQSKGCLSCHEISGHGGKYGPDLSNISVNLPTAAIKIRILRGAGEMPSYANILTPEEVEAIVAFLETRHAP
jgi:ubiquinol-cytochrome c reductase cytochrome b subunit